MYGQYYSKAAVARVIMNHSFIMDERGQFFSYCLTSINFKRVHMNTSEKKTLHLCNNNYFNKK